MVEEDSEPASPIPNIKYIKTPMKLEKIINEEKMIMINPMVLMFFCVGVFMVFIFRFTSFTLLLHFLLSKILDLRFFDNLSLTESQCL